MGRDDKSFESRFEKIERMLEDLKLMITNRMTEMDNKLKKIEESQKFLSSKHDDFKIIVENLMKDNVELRKQNDIMTKKVDQAERNLQLARNETNDLEQYGRREMVEISGVPRTKDQDVESIISNICSHLNVDIDLDSHVEATHRISARDTANIIVKFSGRKIRDAVYSRKNALRNLTAHDLGLYPKKLKQGLFINEFVSAQ